MPYLKKVVESRPPKKLCCSPQNHVYKKGWAPRKICYGDPKVLVGCNPESDVFCVGSYYSTMSPTCRNHFSAMKFIFKAIVTVYIGYWLAKCCFACCRVRRFLRWQILLCRRNHFSAVKFIFTAIVTLYICYWLAKCCYACCRGVGLIV